MRAAKYLGPAESSAFRAHIYDRKPQIQYDYLGEMSMWSLQFLLIRSYVRFVVVVNIISENDAPKRYDDWKSLSGSHIKLGFLEDVRTDSGAW